MLNLGIYSYWVPILNKIIWFGLVNVLSLIWEGPKVANMYKLFENVQKSYVKSYILRGFFLGWVFHFSSHYWLDYAIHSFLQDNGYVGDEFMRQIEPIAAYLPYMTCPGNHEEA